MRTVVVVVVWSVEDTPLECQEWRDISHPYFCRISWTCYLSVIMLLISCVISSPLSLLKSGPAEVLVELSVGMSAVWAVVSATESKIYSVAFLTHSLLCSASNRRWKTVLRKCCDGNAKCISSGRSGQTGLPVGRCSGSSGLRLLQWSAVDGRPVRL